MRLVRFAFALSLVSGTAYAQTPSISSVNGTISEGNAITIAGANFGAAGPTIVVFDDFEGGANGTAVSLTNVRAGAWGGRGTGQVPVYSTEQHISGSRAMKVDTVTNPTGGSGMAANFNSNDMFASFWVMVPAGDNAIGNGNQPNWKMTWLYRSGTGDSDIAAPATSALGGSPYASNWQMFGNDQPMSDDNSSYFGSCASHYSSCSSSDWSFNTGVWYRVMQYFHGSPSDGSAISRMWVSAADENKAMTKHYDSTHANTRTGGTWQEWVINGFSRQTVSGRARIYFDDVYIASGTNGNAQARVELGDAATYANCRNLTILSPTNWGASNITAVVRQGRFAANARVYLYVTNSSGVVNASGVAVTVGADTSTSGPSAPTNLRIVSN